MAILQLTLPVLVILSFIVFKLNHEQKRWFFRIPVLISATALSFTIGKAAGGVMAFYGAALCDIILWPSLLLVKKVWEKQEKRKLQKVNTTAPALPRLTLAA
jgi:uncharacterized membrane protein